MAVYFSGASRSKLLSMQFTLAALAATAIGSLMRGSGEGAMLHTATEDDIRAGRLTDVYFENTRTVLRAKGILKHVVMEVRAASLPPGYDWAVLAGIEEVASVMQGINASVWTMEEGSIFHVGEPVLSIEGEYTEFGVLETPLLGLVCQASGIATRAARCKQAAGDRLVISFGARRMHPAISPMIERNAYLGGCDGVAVIMSGDLIGQPAVGTMPHALILVVGDSVQAFKLFDEVMPASVPRICLIDTLGDEKFEAVAAAEALGDHLFGVRLDTPGSRRGNMAAILREVRWELDLRGYQHVKLIVSGGIDEETIAELNPYCDGYGVGTAIADAPTINFAMDIVEIDGVPFAKRGKWSGRKQILECPDCHSREIVPAHKEEGNAFAPTGDSTCRAGSPRPAGTTCGGQRVPLVRPLADNGKLVRELKPVKELREEVLRHLAGI